MERLATLVFLAVMWSTATAQATFHGNNARTGGYEGTGPTQTPAVQWTFKAAGPIVTSPAMRRLARPSGAISRRGATAVRMAEMQAPAATVGTTTLSMFRLYTAQPSVMIFTLPPTRGMVSFDAVTSRLPSQFQSMTFARGNDTIVGSMPPRPAFVVTGEPAPVISLVGGTVLGGGAATAVRKARLRPRIDGDDFPEPIEPPPHRRRHRLHHLRRPASTAPTRLLSARQPCAI